ncbi:hypothetical protein TSOC_004525 [Tetrabaena socialis]|uniref:LysM domain-containing protein n=1 Tax=Tetrabaena socialis TaxID=47790 RepID=A0A2J8A8L1_9CHLO|nr:hypothetical protein TSOC_004525 [Tetrabaena socialis]|eukprot:PNH08876.1 hypothetical protein TSOC_004525 [Tetrabaena socialis]
MFVEAAIPQGLLPSAAGRPDAEQGWSFGPFRLPAFPPVQPLQRQRGASGAPLASGVAEAAQHLKDLVSGLIPHSGRGGTASGSGAAPAPMHGRKAAGVRLEYSEDTPRLVGKRSIAHRPRTALPLSGWEPLYDDRDSRWWDITETAVHGSYSWALQDYQADRPDAPVPGDAWRAEAPSEEELPPVLTCRDLVKQMLLDQHGRGDAVQCAFPDQPCPIGSYKVMAFTSPVPSEDEAANYCDRHFYVQHKDVSLTMQPGDKLEDVAGFFKVPVDDLYDANPGLSAWPQDRPVDRERSVMVRGANVWSHKPSEWMPPRLHDGAGRAIHNPARAVPAYSDEEGELLDLPSTYCCSFCVRRGEAKTGPQPRAPISQE